MFHAFVGLSLLVSGICTYASVIFASFWMEHVAQRLMAGYVIALLAATVVALQAFKSEEEQAELRGSFTTQLLSVFAYAFEGNFFLWSSVAGLSKFATGISALWASRGEGFPDSDLSTNLAMTRVVAGAMELCWMAGICELRRRMMGQSTKLIREDKQRYDEIWQAILQEQRAAIDRLVIVADRIEGECPGIAQHVTPCGTPATSLDLIFSQATYLDGLLRAKVQQWALASNGCFLSLPPKDGGLFRRPSSISSRGSLDESGGLGKTTWKASEFETGSFVVWKEVYGTPEERQVRWCAIKSANRAIEKVHRSYKDDVSLLVDVCRQAIYFEKVEHITQCLEVIATDIDITIQRIKNRMHPQYDPEQSAGYRDVMLNVSIATERTSRLMVANHLCEVQLVLVPIAENKNEQGHARYREWRNCRGE